MIAATDATAIGAILAGIAAFVTAAFSAFRNRRVDSRDDMETIVDGFKDLLAAERALTDRQVTTLTREMSDLKDDLVEVHRLHEDCEAERRTLIARLGLG